MPDDFKILPPDFSLRDKVGGGAALNQVFSQKSMEAAQNVIVETSPLLIDECVTHCKELRAAMPAHAGELTAEIRKKLAAISFAIKEKSSLADYHLVAALADSLTNLMEAEETALSRPLIEWHIQGITHLLTNKIAGDGGAVGVEIRKELAKIENKSKKLS